MCSKASQSRFQPSRVKMIDVFVNSLAFSMKVQISRERVECDHQETAFVGIA